MPQSKKAKQSKKLVKHTSVSKSSSKNGRSKRRKSFYGLDNKAWQEFKLRAKKVGLTATQLLGLLKWNRDYAREYNREEEMKWKDDVASIKRKKMERFNLPRPYQNLVYAYNKKEQERRMKAFFGKGDWYTKPKFKEIMAIYHEVSEESLLRDWQRAVELYTASKMMGE